jgi:hypothetical protein
MRYDIVRYSVGKRTKAREEKTVQCIIPCIAAVQSQKTCSERGKVRRTKPSARVGGILALKTLDDDALAFVRAEDQIYGSLPAR